jgi:hypothetical protein
MAKVPLPPETPSWRKKKAIKPEDMPMSPAMQEYLKSKTEEEGESRAQEAAADEEKEAYKVRGYNKGGSVRGVGIAVRGKGKGRMC